MNSRPITNKNLALILLLLVVGLAGQASPLTHRLKNGLEVYHLRSEVSQFVTLALVFDAGPIHQAPEYNGISRLGINFLNVEPIAATGAIVEHHLWSGGYSLLITAATDSVATVIQALGAVFDNIQASSDEFLVVQNRVGRWIERAYSDNTFRAQRGLLMALWGDQWQRKTSLGDSRLVYSTSQAEVAAWSRRYIVPRNCTLIVIGDIDDDQLMDYLETHIEPLPPGANPFAGGERVTFPYLINDVDTLVVTNPVSPSFNLAWQGPGFGQDPAGTYAARVFVELLNNESGAFQQAIRATGSFVRVHAEFEPSKYLSTILLHCFPNPGSVAQTTALVEQILDDYTSSGEYSRSQIIDARKAAQVAHAQLFQSSTLLARALAESWPRGELDIFHRFGVAITGVARLEIERFVTNYIVGQPRVGAYLMKPGDFRQARKYEYEGAIR